jgi:ATP-dependent DNA helicase DinG
MKSIKDCWSMGNRNPRKSQLTSFEFIEQNINKKYFFLELPTGAGKTGCSKTLANYFEQFNDKKSAYFLTHQKLLQQQYVNDFDDIEPLYGKSNYKCKGHNTTCDVGGLLKPRCSSCPSAIASEKAMKSNYTILNYSLMLSSILFTEKIEPRKIMVLDECHLLENILVDFNTILINFATCTRHKIEFKPSKEYNISNVQQWIKTEYYPKMDRVLANILNEFDHLFTESKKKLTKEDISTLKYISSLQEHLSTINEFIDFDNDYINHNFIVTDENGNLKIKYIFGKHNFNKLLKPMADKFLLMSATILDHEEMCNNLGIPLEEACFLSLATEFEQDNIPIIYNPAVKLSYNWQNDSNNIKLLKTAIVDILKQHSDDNGIIHTGNFQVSKIIVEFLENNKTHEILHHNPSSGDDREDIIKEFLKSKKPTILISPSITTGIDLHDDLSRFSIIAKISYQSLADTWVKSRMNESKTWYGNDASRTFMQAVGRICRHHQDYGVTYVLDSNFENLLRNSKFPKWFKETIHRL